MRVVRHARGDVLNRLRARLAQQFALDGFSVHLHRRADVDKMFLDPRMARAARVACTAHHGANLQAFFRPQAGFQKIVYGLFKMRQFVDEQRVDLHPRIQEPVARGVTVAEVHPRTVDKFHRHLALVEARNLRRDEFARLQDQRVGQFAVAAAEQIRLQPRRFQTPLGRFHRKGRRFAAARRAAVEHLVRRALVEQGLLSRRPVGNRMRLHRPPPPLPPGAAHG